MNNKERFDIAIEYLKDAKPLKEIKIVDGYHYGFVVNKNDEYYLDYYINRYLSDDEYFAYELRYIEKANVFALCMYFVNYPISGTAKISFIGACIVTPDKHIEFYKVKSQKEIWKKIKKANDDYNCFCYVFRDAPLGHDYKKEVISPTHFKKGYSVFTCARCGDSYTDKETEIIPHTYDDGIITKQPTCTETGIKLYTCTCGNTKEETIKATGHKEGQWETTKQATCTEDGLKIKKCTVCKETIETEVLTKFGHDYKETIIAPTCTKDGYTKHVCNRCGDTFTDKVTAKLEHNFDAGKITKTPTCASTGIKTFTCNSCGFTKTQTLAKNTSNHTGGVTSITTLQATCGANGSYYDKCNGCNAVLGTYIIPATGLHAWYQYEWIIYSADRIQDIHWKCSTCGADGGWTH